MNKYTADLSINEYQIDKEILQQAQKYYEWAQAAAEAEVERDDAKDRYELYLIDIENDVRTIPEKYFDTNKTITEGAIKSAINSDLRTKKLLKKYNKAKKTYKLLVKAEKAFEQRKRMIESYLYYINKNKEGEPRTPRKFEKRYNREVKKQIEVGLTLSKRRK